MEQNIEVISYIDKEKDSYIAKGSNPLEAFLFSLNGCIGIYAKRYLLRHDIEFKELKIQASAEFTTLTPARLINIKVKVHTDANLGDMKDTFLRFIKNCPIHNTIIHTKEVEIKILQFTLKKAKKKVES